MSIDFLVIGTAKAGTTSLHGLLSTHGRMRLSRPKETWFFDGSNYANGLDWYISEYYGDGASQAIRGEVATSYLYVPYVAERIAREAPHARLIAILRDPIERAYSDWWMMHTRGWEPLSFDAAITDNLKRLETGPDFSDPRDWAEHLSEIAKSGKVRYRTYVDYGFYGEQLDRYCQLGFGDQLLVLQFEQMKLEGPSYLQQVFSFLQIEPPPVAILEAEFTRPQNEALPSRRIGQSLSLLHSTGLSRFVPLKMKQAAKTWLGRHRGTPIILPATRERLEAVYRARPCGLERFTGVDVSLWSTYRHPQD